MENRKVVKVEASWPPKKPGSYFRTLRRLLDLLECWEKGEGNVTEIIYGVSKDIKTKHLCFQLYLYQWSCSMQMSSVFTLFLSHIVLKYDAWESPLFITGKTIQAEWNAERRWLDPRWTKVTTAGITMPSTRLQTNLQEKAATTDKVRRLHKP